LESISNELLAVLKEKESGSTKILGAVGDEPLKKSEHILSVSKAKLGVSQGKPANLPPSVLIVDDEPDILDVIKEALEMQGIKCSVAATGEEAVRLAVELKPDLIFMDVLLKNQNGLEICAQIKEKLTSFTPVILMTGQQDVREKISGSTQGADEILIKPFQMVELKARVASMLRIKKMQDALEARQ
jgi:PleD family two-component response regulator